MTEKQKLYGWQSDLHDADWGSVIWSGVDGHEVEVSTVTESPDDSGTGWPDIKFVGEVVEYLRQGKEGKVTTRWYRKDSYPYRGAIQMATSWTPPKESVADYAFQLLLKERKNAQETETHSTPSAS